MFKIYSELNNKDNTERREDVTMLPSLNFEHIQYIALLFPLLTLNK